MRVLFLLLFMLMTVPAYAAEETSEQKGAETEAPAEPVNPVNPYIEQIDAAVQGFREKNLSEDQARTLYQIKQAHGIVQSVRSVNGDVSEAVEACGRDNPEIKDEIGGRYEKWWAAIKPVTDETETRMNDAIDKQDFMAPKEIRDYLDLFVKAAEYSESLYQTSPVTTRQACDSLLESMNTTEQTLKDLLAGVEITKPIEKGEGDENGQNSDEESGK